MFLIQKKQRLNELKMNFTIFMMFLNIKTEKLNRIKNEFNKTNDVQKKKKNNKFII